MQASCESLRAASAKCGLVGESMFPGRKIFYTCKVKVQRFCNFYAGEATQVKLLDKMLYKILQNAISSLRTVLLSVSVIC